MLQVEVERFEARGRAAERRPGTTGGSTPSPSTIASTRGRELIYARAVADVRELRRALLDLHGELLQAQRVEGEPFGGRMSSSEVMQAAIDGLHFTRPATCSRRSAPPARCDAAASRA